MKRTFFIIPILLVINLFLAPMNHVRAQTPSPVVHAALFYSPDCPHCQYVITEALPPLLKKYGTQLQIIAVDVNQPQGQTLFIAALKKFGVEEGGVPFLVFDNTYLMGSQDIPEKFPGLIESYLSKGGVDWPAIPGLREALLATTEPQATAAPGQPATPQASLTAASPAP